MSQLSPFDHLLADQNKSTSCCDSQNTRSKSRIGLPSTDSGASTQAVEYHRALLAKDIDQSDTISRLLPDPPTTTFRLLSSQITD
jgi:hypothetical protein